VQAEAATAAGADVVGAEELIEAIKGGKIDFERAFATPDAMPLLGQVARILGPKGLMPNPKRGTVVTDIGPAVTEAKAGQYEFKAEKAGVVHGPVGKLSFGVEKLHENLEAFIQAVLAKRPDSFRGKPPKVRRCARGAREARVAANVRDADERATPCVLCALRVRLAAERGDLLDDGKGCANRSGALRLSREA
jgi:hypothetical protein